MNQYTIESNIPVPTSFCHVKGFMQLLREMNPGDSVLLPLKGKNSQSAMANKVFGKGCYAVRKVDDKSFRLWRTA